MVERSGKHPTRAVQIPSRLVWTGDGPSPCHLCRACQITAQRPTLNRDTVRRLATGRGVPLRVLLTMYRWARAYAGVPGGSPEGTWERNAVVRISHSQLAEEALGANTQEQHCGYQSAEYKAVQRAVAQLERLGLLVIIRRGAEPNLYAPHAIGESVQIPQHLWKRGAVGRSDTGEDLRGNGLLVLVSMLSATYNRVPDQTPDAQRSSVPNESPVLTTLPSGVVFEDAPPPRTLSVGGKTYPLVDATPRRTERQLGKTIVVPEDRGIPIWYRQLAERGRLIHAEGEIAARLPLSARQFSSAVRELHSAGWIARFETKGCRYCALQEP